jgi:hypothetical protein
MAATVPDGEYMDLTKWAAEGKRLAAEKAREGAGFLARGPQKSGSALLMTIAAGVVGTLALTSDTVRKMAWVRQYWWALGLALLGLAWYLKSRPNGGNGWWPIVASLGASTLAIEYRRYEDEKKQGQPAAGIDEAGEVYDWQTGADGRPAFGPKTRSSLADAMADKVFRTG